MTLQEALDQGYRYRGPKKYAKTGEIISVFNPKYAAPVNVVLTSTADVHAAGFRFPFERIGQWNRQENPHEAQSPAPLSRP